jgi:hypothetical protein
VKIFLFKLPGKITTIDIRKLFIAGKVRIMDWQEEGMSTPAIADLLGRHCYSIYCLLGKVRAPLKVSTMGLDLEVTGLPE